MKFWELNSICRDQPKLLAKTLSRSCWRSLEVIYNDFSTYVGDQERTILDMEVPENLCIEVLEQHPGQVFLFEGVLRSYRFAPAEEALTYLDTFLQFGGSALEEILEKGSIEF